MKLTSDKVFFDTNIMVYCYTGNEPNKKVISQKLALENDANISTQVVQEFINVLSRKYKQDWPVIQNSIKNLPRYFNVFTNQFNTIVSATQVADRYHLSFYDSLIIAAALECDCTTLYSEDMHDGLVIESKLTIINPFK